LEKYIKLKAFSIGIFHRALKTHKKTRKSWARTICGLFAAKAGAVAGPVCRDQREAAAVSLSSLRMM
jgi:hypothetical protein